MKYFTITHGLRGCYMPDSDPFAVACATRKELKDIIIGECDMLRGDRTMGFSKRAIAAFAAECWREAHEPKPAYLPYCLPCKERGQDGYSYGVFCSVATRHEFLALNKGEWDNDDNNDAS